MNPSIKVIIPAFNEADNIASLFEKFIDLKQKLNLHLIVVDDGSQDDTIKVSETFASQIPITLVKHQQNQGLGVTLKDGLIKANLICDPGDLVAIMDGDDTHDPAQLLSMQALIRTEGLDLIIASRFRPGAEIYGLRQWRKILSYGAALIFIILRPISGVRDYTCGYRLMKASSLRLLIDRFGDTLITESGFAATAQILLRCRALKISCGEIPLILHYDRKKGVSKMNITRTIRRTLSLCYTDIFQS
ncbi:MAG: glycosyltransferase [Saprospiraceae bacterium]|jgi:dolichol-phosphate mannosyltransferase|nr:glycosyltransferase [Saprospiraceae bacterium]MBK6480841.1 glycosyltransferase [Saprospiraceae bacterium]MBK7371332.1 glycosyltransferase [Saprospiraceae bacterium]MBK7608447.1 glycosyltransferase [Saprospiraceae bacterium]MBK8776893.1 glycosyltransferase [Saprospiraceae bacterium]